MTTARREAALIAAALVAIVAVAYAAPLFGGATFVGRDHLTGTIPAKQVIADALAAGHLPAWWDTVSLGVPFAANPAHSALYPPTWLVAVLPMPWSADLLQIVHVLWAGLGCAAFARRLGADVQGAIFAGSAFMLGGFASSTVVTGVGVLTLAWIPWIAWAADRVAGAHGRAELVRSALALAAVVAAVLLTGEGVFSITGGWIALAVVACRAHRRLPALAATAAALAVAVALAAVIIVPVLFFASDSPRASGIDHDTAVAWSMHPLRVLEWVWPDALGDPNQETRHLARAVADAASPLRLSPSWALSVYLSLPVVVLAVLGWVRGDRRFRLLAIIALAFIVLSLGRYTPMYGLYRLVFVPERLVRYPEKYLAGAFVMVCAVAGVGWTSLVTRGLSRRAAWGTGGAIAAFALGVGVVALARGPLAGAIDTHGLAPALDAGAAVEHAARRGVTTLVVVVAIAALLYLARRRPRLVPVALVACIGHLVAHTWTVLPTFDREVLARPPQIVRGLAAGSRIGRPDEHRVRPDDSIAARARTLYEGAAPNAAVRFGIGYLFGYDQGHSATFQRWWAPLAAAPARAHDLYAIDHEIVPADELGDRRALATDAPFGPYALVANAGARPRAFVTSSVRWYPDETALLAALLPPSVQNSDPATLATVHLVGRGSDATGPPALSPCELDSPRPERVRLVCDSAAGGYAVLLDGWARGWSATVDGRPAAIERAEGLVRAIAVGPGRHVIDMRYATPGLRTGALISLLAWLALGGAALVLRRRARSPSMAGLPATSAAGPSSP